MTMIHFYKTNFNDSRVYNHAGLCLTLTVGAYGGGGRGLGPGGLVPGGVGHGGLGIGGLGTGMQTLFCICRPFFPPTSQSHLLKT